MLARGVIDERNGIFRAAIVYLRFRPRLAHGSKPPSVEQVTGWDAFARRPTDRRDYNPMDGAGRT